MADIEQARELGQAIVETARGNGLATAALLTDMDSVLGRTAGNAVEVREAVDHLTGAEGNDRLVEVTLALSTELLRLGGLDGDPRRALDSGAAAEAFARMVAALGGPADLLERPGDHLPVAPVRVEAAPDRAGFVTAKDVRAVGMAIIDLGGGRRREDDPIDHAVGLTGVAAVGEEVGPDARPLAIIHARDEAAAGRAAEDLRAAFKLGDAPPPSRPAVIEALGT
jgi:thymidine phosphorylase